jgi:hypothetical protein
MSIKWSALAVSEAMDEVEGLLARAALPLTEAKTRVGKATGIAHLPGYMDQRLRRLLFTIDRMQDIRGAIDRVREDIPQDALTAERQAGKQQLLELEVEPCVMRKPDDFMEAVHKGISLK